MAVGQELSGPSGRRSRAQQGRWAAAAVLLHLPLSIPTRRVCLFKDVSFGSRSLSPSRNTGVWGRRRKSLHRAKSFLFTNEDPEVCLHRATEIQREQATVPTLRSPDQGHGQLAAGIPHQQSPWCVHANLHTGNSRIWAFVNPNQVTTNSGACHYEDLFLLSSTSQMAENQACRRDECLQCLGKGPFCLPIQFLAAHGGPRLLSESFLFRLHLHQPYRYQSVYTAGLFQRLRIY